MVKKILVVEDEPYIRKLLIQTLERGFDDSIDNEELEILEAKNGEEGLQIAKKEHPALIFLDVMMPKKDGFQVCREIKEDSNTKDIYVVLLTAKGQEVDKKKGATVGADEYITKPFDPELIISRVEEEINIRRCDRTHESPYQKRIDNFKECPCCGYTWLARVGFMKDPNLDLVGYQVNFDNLLLGFFIFSHVSCGSTIAVPAGHFRDLYDGPVFSQRLAGTEKCPEYCFRVNELRPCPEQCDCAYVREILQIVRDWSKGNDSK
jgi:two-component system, OmpR family, alkaline phosphatase synthesis response regulator PhoP